MSGHIRDRQEFTRSGIPCLGSLPWIGPAFSSTLESREKRNLIFFIRPHVLNNVVDGIVLTEKEGYDYNWESCPQSLRECGTEKAPESACGSP